MWVSCTLSPCVRWAVGEVGARYGQATSGRLGHEEIGGRVRARGGGNTRSPGPTAKSSKATPSGAERRGSARDDRRVCPRCCRHDRVPFSRADEDARKRSARPRASGGGGDPRNGRAAREGGARATSIEPATSMALASALPSTVERAVARRQHRTKVARGWCGGWRHYARRQFSSFQNPRHHG